MKKKEKINNPSISKSTPFFSPTIQRDSIESKGEEGKQDFQLRAPALTEGLYKRPDYGFNLPPLTIDPEIEAQMRVFRLLHTQLSIPNLTLGASLLNTPNLGLGSANLNAPLSFSQRFLNLPMQSTPPMNLNLPKQNPLVPGGKGPAQPRAGTAGDVISAIMKIPAVETGITQLKTKAKRRISSDWKSLSKGDKAIVITHGIIMGAGIGAAISSSPETQQFLTEQISGKKISIPKSPLSIQLNLIGENKGAVLFLDVGSFFNKR